MTHRGHHLQEDRLFDCYLTARNGEHLDPPAAEHLTDCEDCNSRYVELTRFMDSLATEAAAEADAMFTPDRLRAQRHQIERRLEHLGHPARVISFPSRAAGAHPGSSAPRPARRWIAAAAAAGLFVGVATGLFLDWERAPGRRASGVFARQTVLTSTDGRQGRVAGPLEVSLPDRSAADKDFLYELELAGERPHIPELSAVDALTPHVREINLR